MRQMNDKHIIAAIKSVLAENKSLRHPREPETIGELNFLKETGYWPVPDEKMKAIYNSTRDKLRPTYHIYQNAEEAKINGDRIHDYDPNKVVDIAKNLDMDSDNVLIYQLRANWDVEKHDYILNSFNVRTDYDNDRYLNIVFQYDRHPTIKTAWVFDKNFDIKPELDRYIKSKKERVEKVKAYTDYLKWKNSFKDNGTTKPADDENNSGNIEISEVQLCEMVRNVAVAVINEQSRHGALYETEDYLGNIIRGFKSLGRSVIDSSGMGRKIGDWEKKHPNLTKVMSKVFGTTPEADKAKGKTENLKKNIVKYISSEYGQSILESFTNFYNSICSMIGAPSEANGYQFNNNSVVPSQFYNQCAYTANQAIGFIEKWLPTHANDFDKIESIPDNGLYNGVDNRTRYEVASQCQKQWNTVYNAFIIFYGVLTHCYEYTKNKFGTTNVMPTKDVMKVVNQIASMATMLRNSVVRINQFWFAQQQQQNGYSRP